MSDLQDLIHRNAQLAFEQGVKTERERIIKILESLAQHDEEMCYFDGKLICYPEDCNAGVFAWTLQLIQNERTNNKQT